MLAFLYAGWLCVPYDGPDATLVQIGLAAYGSAEIVWTPAFLDWVDGRRVAKIRPGPVVGRPQIWLESAGGSQLIGPYPS